MVNKMKTFYKDKKILITGHTGFKGSWLALWLSELGADITGISLAPDTTPSLFNALNLQTKMTSYIEDIRNYNAIKEIFTQTAPDIVFHLAAQPLVRHSYDFPIETLETNIIGTANILNILKDTPSVKAFINVTSDKCYLNNGDGIPFTESDHLGGADIYSASKACSEIITDSFRSSFFSNGSNSPTKIASVRAGNVIGGGDWSKDRLIPDFIRAIQSNTVIELRYPNAVRPWQHVLDPLSGYLLLAQKLYESSSFSGAWNFGPNDDAFITVENVVKTLITIGGNGQYEINHGSHLHEASLLTLDISKAKSDLKWRPSWSVHTALEKTIQWYQAYSSNPDHISEFTQSQIMEFSHLFEMSNNEIGVIS